VASRWQPEVVEAQISYLPLSPNPQKRKRSSDVVDYTTPPKIQRIENEGEVITTPQSKTPHLDKFMVKRPK